MASTLAIVLVGPTQVKVDPLPPSENHEVVTLPSTARFAR
jgi:hypothetical protein